MAEGENGNIGIAKPLSSSAEDLSEYTDADESISSAPTEFLAEFLSAVMMKDYKTALKYCHLILQYEPNNSTAKDFYPLIITKLRMESNNKSSESSENDLNFPKDIENNSESSSSDCNSDSSSSSGDADDDDEEEEEEQLQGNSSGSGDRHSDRTTASYSSLEDDDQLIDANNYTCNAASKYSDAVDNADFGNGNVKIGTMSPPLPAKKAWEVSTSKVEKELYKKLDHITLNIHASSDSESPTEPVSQQLIAQLRSRVINKKQ